MARKGTGLSIHQRKNGSWRAQIRKVGFPNESKDFLTHEAADEWGLRRLSEIQVTGRLINRQLAERTSLGQAIEAYIAKVTATRPAENSRVSEEARLRRFLREEKYLCDHALAYIAPPMLEAWRDRRLLEKPSRGPLKECTPGTRKPVPHGRYRADGTLRKNAAQPPTPKPVKPISPGTVKREMTLLKRVFDFAMREYSLASNPLAANLVDRPAVQDARDVRISFDEWERLLRECYASRNPWLGYFVEIALEIGTRKGSLLKLVWSDVHLEDSYVVLRGTKNSRRPKEERVVEVGLSPRAIEILSRMPRSRDGRVFPVKSSTIYSAYRNARCRAGVSHFRIHDIRHELASRLAEAGWEMLDLMKQGDWKDPKSLARYYNPRGTYLGSKLAATPRHR